MNIRMAEEVALDYGSGAPRWPSELHCAAFAWADKKKHDRRVSPEYRKRAASVARRLWAAACRPRV